ncbi:MAG: D-alanyl-D-alanine dipeptidase [Myxococcaceae bacterium]|nr:D-alanyl-D-alanine dipeptidase [Myxococcaceae bacterium]
MSPLAALLALAAAPPPLVDAAQAIDGLQVELRYGRPDNFMGKAVYPPGARCLLLAPAVAALQRAAATVAAQGFRLRTYDCYRPRSVQYEMWKVFPKVGFVADPATGSHHNRGAAVDLTLAYPDGGPVEMPTAFDAFTRAAHHGFQGGSEASRRHRAVLRGAMEDAGFERNPMEWWHYQLPDAVKYPLRDEPFAPDAGR